MFDICSIENFRDCEITEEELLDGTYFAWLKEVVAPTLLPKFQERYNTGTMQTDVPMQYFSYGDTSYVAFAPNASFRDENTRPFMRHETFAYMPAEWITPGMKEAGVTATGYFVSTTFMYEVTNPDTGEGIVHPVILLTIGSFDDPKTRQVVADGYNEKHEPMFIIEPKYPDGYEDPMVKNLFQQINRSDRNMDSRTEDFVAGKYGSLAVPGLALMTDFNDTAAGWRKD